MLGDMSMPVSAAELGEAIRARPLAYLLSPGSERPHVVQVVPELVDDVLHCEAPGRSAIALAQSHPAVSLLLPPAHPDGHCLIIDGVAHAHGDALHVKVDHAVLHRRATAESSPSATGCGADCHPVSVDGT
jgi:hypothetical protein